MQNEFATLMRDAKDIHAALYATMKELQAARLPQDVKELVDSVFAMKRAEEFLEDARKEVTRHREKCEQVAGALWAKESLSDDTTDDRIKTEYCTATVSIETQCTIPRKKQEPEQFALLMGFLGVPESTWNTDDPEASEAVKIHWPGFVALLSKLEREGKPLPPGIDSRKTFKRFKLAMRAKNRSGDDV